MRVPQIPTFTLQNIYLFPIHRPSIQFYTTISRQEDSWQRPQNISFERRPRRKEQPENDTIFISAAVSEIMRWRKYHSTTYVLPQPKDLRVNIMTAWMLIWGLGAWRGVDVWSQIGALCINQQPFSPSPVLESPLINMDSLWDTVLFTYSPSSYPDITFLMRLIPALSSAARTDTSLTYSASPPHSLLHASRRLIYTTEDFSLLPLINGPLSTPTTMDNKSLFVSWWLLGWRSATVSEP